MPHDAATKPAQSHTMQYQAALHRISGAMHGSYSMGGAGIKQRQLAKVRSNQLQHQVSQLKAFARMKLCHRSHPAHEAGTGCSLCR